MFNRKASTLGIGSFLIGYHLALAILLPYYLCAYSPTWALFPIATVLLYLGGLAITAGYHRLFSHRAYQTRPWIETIMLFFGSTTMQGSALKWSYDHRLHHAHVDTDKDPYSIKKGFMYAHCLWLFEDSDPIEAKTVADLIRNPRVMFQHRYSIACMVLSNAMTTLLCGWYFGDYFGAFVVTYLLRLFVLHHFTWFINSLAHTWGSKPFSEEQSAVDNYLISLFTFGEGYHNYHHTYANDYRNGIKWYHFDPSKWLVWTLNRFGLASGLRRVSSYAVNKRIIMERKERMLEQVHEMVFIQKDLVEQRIQELSERLDEKLASLNKLGQKYAEFKRENAARDSLRSLQEEMRQLKQSLKVDFRRWSELYATIGRLGPLESFA